MPKKYHITVSETPPRFAPVSKYSTFEITRCYGCRQCVKLNSCIYGVYKKRVFDPIQVQDTAENICISCMRCVQECKNNIFVKSINPRYERIGDEYWTPDIIDKIWKQSSTGKIPVSGAGYRGPFAGPGFDRMWTDMSEIVRPTRDGIHGREYISSVIELGRKPDMLEFDENNNMITEPPPFKEISIPVVLDIPELSFLGEETRKSVAKAAGLAESMAVATYDEAVGILSEFKTDL